MTTEIRIFTDEADAWRASSEREGEAIKTGADRREVLGFVPRDGRGEALGGTVILWRDNKPVYLAVVSRTEFNASALVEVYEDPARELREKDQP